jgi:hypothetical protein
MNAGNSDKMEPLDRAMHLSNLRHDLAEQTFYALACALDREIPAADTARLAEAKRRLIADTVEVLPLAAGIVAGDRLACESIADPFVRDGAASCFRVHEILRKTRRHPEARILLGTVTIPREALLAQYRQLVPNTNLEPLSPYTPFTLPRILAVSGVGGVIAGGWAGREQVPEVWFDPLAGLIGTATVAVCFSLLGQLALSRNPFRTAPWNAAICNDVHFALYRRDPAALHLARGEFVERNHFIKGGLNGRKYIERSEAIASGAYLDVLRHRAATPPAAGG